MTSFPLQLLSYVYLPQIPLSLWALSVACDHIYDSFFFWILKKKNWYHLDRSSNNFWTFSWDFYTITVSSSFPNHTLPLPPQSDQFTTYSKQVKLCFAYRYFLRIDPYTQKNSINVYSIGLSQTIQISKITKFILASLDKYGRCWHFLNTDIFLKNIGLSFFSPEIYFYI